MVRVLVIREDDVFSQRLRRAGYQVTNLPLTRTEPIEDLSELDGKLAAINDYDGIFFTSPEAARIFVSKTTGMQIRSKFYVLGERSAAVIERAGFPVERRPANTAEDLLDAFGTGEFAGKRLLFVRGERSIRTIPERLSSIARVDETVVYRTVAAEQSDIPSGSDWACFFSPSGVEAFARLRRPNGTRIAAIGRTTANAATELGFRVDFVSERAGAMDFAEGFIGYLNSFE